MKLKGFRLPTEAEWEFAARYEKGEKNNDDNTAVPYSNGLWLTKLNFASGATNTFSYAPETKLVAWYSDNSGGTTHEVGTRAPNKLGLFDMSGNVYEWCFDWYGDITAPETVTDPQGAASGATNRVLRSCASYSTNKECSVGFRKSQTPGSYGDGYGFRLAKSL